MERGLGRTTRQILASPPKSIYIARDASGMIYCRDLGTHLGRTDLVYSHISYLVSVYRSIIIRKTPVVIDHSATSDDFMATQHRTVRQNFWRAYHHLKANGLVDAT